MIEAQRDLCRTWLSVQQQEAGTLPTNRPYEWLVHQFRIGQIEAMLAWLDTCQEVLTAPIVQP